MNLVKKMSLPLQIQFIRKIAVIGWLSLLVGCMGSPQLNNTSFDPNNFTAQGKIALRYPNCPEFRSCQEEGVSASMDWIHREQEDSLTFYDPLGQAQASLIYDQGLIVIEQDGQSRTASEASLAQELGIPVPVQSLRELILNQQEQENFDYQGWQVQVKDWQGQFYRSVRLKQDSYYVRVIIYAIQ